MAAFYNSVEYTTLEEALAARAGDTNPLATITIVGATEISVSGGDLAINQSVDIVAGSAGGLNGTLTVLATDVSFDGIVFADDTPGAVLVKVAANQVSIVNSEFNGAGTASRAFVASNPDFTFEANTITGFVDGSYINPGVTGSIAGNAISNSGNGFVVDSTGVEISQNTFSTIERSNISISATDPETDLSAYFDFNNSFDGTGTQIAATRFVTATDIIGSSQSDLIVNDSAATSAFQFDGLGGNDTANSGQGNDTIDGGIGTDTVVFSGAQNEYSVSRDGDTVVVSDNRGVPLDGTDILIDVETLQFSDGTIQTSTIDDVTAPTLAITVSPSAVNEDSNSTVTFTFSEAPTDFAAGDIAVTQGSGGISAFTQTSATTYTAVFTPTADFDDTATISVANGAFTDAAFNPGIGDSETIDVDAADPTLAITVSSAAVNEDGNSTVTFTFSEEVTGFTDADVGFSPNPSSGTISGFAQTSATTYTALFTPRADFDGTATFSVADGAFTDAAGNLGTGDSEAIDVDAVDPTVAVDIVDTTLNNADRTSTVTFTFSEAPTGFTDADVVVTPGSGAISAFTATANPLVYTATFTADPSFTGNGTVSVGTGYTDAAGNTGVGGSDTVAIATSVGGGGGGGGVPPVTPTDGDDDVVGTVGEDTVAAGGGDDTVFTGAGNDSVNGNAGDDTVNGGQGDDFVQGGQGADFVQGGQGNDTAFGDAGDDVVFGDLGDDNVNGNAGNDEVNGNVGNDTVSGGQGNDVISGGQGNDQLFGDAGDDLLNGDLGDDIMTGGAGSDVFQFSANAGANAVTDFDFAQGDRLDLQGQSYVVGQNNEGEAALFLEDGGTIVLLGYEPGEFRADFVVA